MEISEFVSRCTKDVYSATFKKNELAFGVSVSVPTGLISVMGYASFEEAIEKMVSIIKPLGYFS